MVQRVLDRLVIIRYAEDHLIAPAGMLHDVLELTRTNLYTFSLSQHVRQIFRGFDGRHNSALFASHLADQADFSNETLSGLIDKLYEARYRAMTPDIMGNTYEQYLGKALVIQNPLGLADPKGLTPEITTRDNLETRKKQGSYYTPQVIVRYIVDNSLGRYLYGTVDGRPHGQPLDDERRKTHEEIADLRLIDPACGSGGFLIYAYQVSADFYRGQMKRITQERAARYDELVASGMTMPFDLELQLTPYTAALEQLRNYPRLILEKHLYGVDLDPQAAELATVNLIMRAMADQRGTEKRLPLILNQNVKVGNALIGAGPDDPRYADHADKLAELRRLRLALAAGQNGEDHADKLARVEALTAELDAALNEDLQPYFAAPETSQVSGKPARSWVDHVRPLHWAVAFPELFVDEEGQSLGDRGGFTVVVGNPPWEIVKPDLREYYAQFDAEIESKLTRKKVEARIAELNAADPELAAGWEEQKARIALTAAYYKKSGAYSRQGRGSPATHKLFTERGYTLLQNGGRLGYIIPSGIYSDLGTKELREMLLKEGRIEFLYNFSNERFFFQDVHHAYHFTLMGLQKGINGQGFWATFRFNPRIAVSPDDLGDFLSKKSNLIFIRNQSISRFSPDSLSIMEFHTQTDYEVVDKIYSENPLLGSEKWNIQLLREFDMTNARHLFNQTGQGVPLYEGKMIHQFDSSYSLPRFWIKETDLRQNHYRIGIRAIASDTNERTLISTILPRKVGAGNSILTVSSELKSADSLFLISVMNSFTLDTVLRMKVTTNVNMFIIYQLPVPCLTAGNPYFDAIVPRAAALTCTTPAFADLWQSVMGHQTSDFLKKSDVSARQRLRGELDAIIAHLYRLSRDDFAHILSTFPLVFPDTTREPPGGFAGRSLRARLPQILPGVDPRPMAVAPRHLQGVTAHRFNFLQIHLVVFRQMEQGHIRRAAHLLMPAPAFDAGTDGAQPGKGVAAFFAIFPGNGQYSFISICFYIRRSHISLFCLMYDKFHTSQVNSAFPTLQTTPERTG